MRAQPLPSSILFALSAWHGLAAQSFVPCEPYGGLNEVKAFFNEEMRFPPQALADNVNGTSVLIFTVTRDGELRDLRIWRSLTPACDAEALRLGRLVRWYPATLGGTNRDAEHYLNVPFNARKYRKQMVQGRRCALLPGDTLRESYRLHEATEVDSAAVPMIRGGWNGFAGAVAAELKYPPDARRLDIQGPVEIELVVEANGNVSNVRAVRDLGGGCGQEAARVVRTFCWKPAWKDGAHVRSVLRVEILFHLADP